MKNEPLKRIFPAEFAGEVKKFLSWNQNNGKDVSNVLVIALQPEVKVLCQKEGLPHVDTLPFFDNESHKRVLMKSHELTTLISENLAFDVERSIKKVLMDTLIFYARFYLNNFLWIIEVLKGIKEKSGNMEICLFRRNVSKVPYAGNNDPFLSYRDRFVGPLAEKYCAAHRLPVNVIEGARRTASQKGEGKGRFTELFWASILRMLYRKILVRLSREKTVFITAPSYNLDRLCKDIQTGFPEVFSITVLPESNSSARYLKSGFKDVLRLLGRKTANTHLVKIPVEIFNTRNATQKKRTLSDIEKAFGTFAREYHGAFSYENCSFWDEFETKVESGLLGYLAGLCGTAAGQKTFLEFLRPDILISAVSLGEYQSWAEASRSHDIPALVIPQKMIVAPSDRYAKIEEYYLGRAQVTDSFTNVASQSPLISEYLEWSNYGGTILETGNLIFSRIDPAEKGKSQRTLLKENSLRTKTIVWAPSMKTRRSRRFYVLETLDELLDAMKDVFGIISEMKDVRLLFRIHPGRAITKDDIIALVPIPGNVSICEGGTFEDVLSTADLLLSFSSTSILESLMNRIPVLLYDKWKRYNHLDATKVENSVPREISSVYYIDDAKVLASSIPWILNAHCGEKNVSGLFDRYVTMKNGLDNFFDFVGNCLSS